MTDEKAIREEVRKRYAQRALDVQKGGGCCGGTSDAVSTGIYATEEVGELPEKAVLASAGCANPVAVAELREGETVLDLGSGGGIDVLLSAKRVGLSGKAYGLDMTDEMLELARENARKAGVVNAEFLKGEMEDMPLPDGEVDIIISNCVVNLSPDKDSVFREAFRVLKPGGRLAIADIIARKEMPSELKRRLELWAGCVAGALVDEEYRQKLAAAGFQDIEIESVREFTTDEAEGAGLGDLVRRYAGKGGDRPGIFSGIIRARKPGGEVAVAPKDEPVQVSPPAFRGCC